MFQLAALLLRSIHQSPRPLAGPLQRQARVRVPRLLALILRQPPVLHRPPLRLGVFPQPGIRVHRHWKPNRFHERYVRHGIGVEPAEVQVDVVGVRPLLRNHALTVPVRHFLDLTGQHAGRRVHLHDG